MKRLLPVVGLLLITSPSWATWTLAQVKDNTACASTTCAVTVSSTAAGNLLVAGIQTNDTSAITISSVTAATCNTTWTHATSANLFNSGDGSVDLFYCLNSVSAKTSITITTSATCSTNCVAIMWEAHSTGGSIAVDSGATPSGTHVDTTCTTCAGVSLTLSGNNDFIAVVAACGATCSAIVGTGFTNDLADPNGNGIGHGITSGSLTAPTSWTQTSGTLACTAAAFQEAGGAAAPSGFNKRQKIEQLERGN